MLAFPLVEDIILSMLISLGNMLLTFTSVNKTNNKEATLEVWNKPIQNNLNMS